MNRSRGPGYKGRAGVSFMGAGTDSLLWLVIGGAGFVVSEGEDSTLGPKAVSVTQSFV